MKALPTKRKHYSDMAQKTSFEEAERQRKTLAQLLDENEQPEEQVEEAPEVPEQSAEDLKARKEAEPVQEEPDVEHEAPSVSPFIQRLRESGYDVSDEIPEEDLQASVIERLRAQKELERQIEQERKEREKLAKELEEARKQMSLPKESAPAPEDPPKETKSIWGPIEELNQELLQYVEQDPSTGYYRSRAEYEEFGGPEAAEKINKFNREIRQRSQALVRDPVRTIWENGLRDEVQKLVEERANQLVEERVKSYGNTLKSAATTAIEKRQQEQERERRLQQFWSENESKFLKTDKSGHYLVDLNGQPVFTDLGRAYSEEVSYLRDTLGITDEEKLTLTAWRNIKHMAPSDEPAPEAAPQKPVETGEQKKRRFLERRSKSEPAVPAGRTGYQEVAQEKPTFTGRISLRDLVEEEEYQG